jgi:regulator of protease activity HflC (stomatin/prohibitin superfamily)
MKSNNTTPTLITVGSVLVLSIVLWGLPQLGVYNRTLAGKAALMEAESTRQVKVLEAKAKKDSATLEAEAEVERAKGVAKANEIIGNSLKGNDEYLRYLYITGLQEQDGKGGEKTVVYIPTDGLVPLPISESGRTVK